MATSAEPRWIAAVLEGGAILHCNGAQFKIPDGEEVTFNFLEGNILCFNSSSHYDNGYVMLKDKEHPTNFETYLNPQVIIKAGTGLVSLSINADLILRSDTTFTIAMDTKITVPKGSLLMRHGQRLIKDNDSPMYFPRKC